MGGTGPSTNRNGSAIESYVDTVSDDAVSSLGAERRAYAAYQEARSRIGTDATSSSHGSTVARVVSTLIGAPSAPCLWIVAAAGKYEFGAVRVRGGS
jgi:hypothetical protein